MYANSAGSVGLVNLLKIPGVFADGLVRVDALSYGATVRGTDGTPSGAPSVTAPVISFRVYDVGNEVSGALRQPQRRLLPHLRQPGAAGFIGLSINVTHNVTQNLGLT